MKMNITLKPFQERALAKLRKQFLKLWKTDNRRLNLIFKSPTGSGKTVMMAQFLKDLTGDPQFDADKAFLWVSFSEDSYVQSKNKFRNYYDGAGEITLLDLSDLNRKKLEKNNVFFINWQKVKASTKEGRKLRRETEKTEFDKGIFDEFIIRTQKEGRDLVLIVDESHTQTDTELAAEVIDLINPRIIIKVTATPKEDPSYSDVEHHRAGFVEVEREEVVEYGLIKEKIITQTKEDLDKFSKKEIDQDILLLELAYKKRLELKKHYEKLDIEYINPLVLIQLPNDDIARKETLDKSKEEIVKEFLRNKGVKDHEIAVWLSEKKENLEEIVKGNSDVDFLIFKQAAATGWDCPRAIVLVMFREIKSPTFHTQTVGRIIRMPEAKHYNIPELNNGYLYTNYERNQIQLPDSKQGKNKPFIFKSKRKDDVEHIILESTYLSRTDYNDLGIFQFTFEKVADKFFGTKEGPVWNNIPKIKDKGIETEKLIIPNKLIVDAEIENYDDFVEEIKNKGEDLEKDISRNDLERTYNLLCFNIIDHQEEENKKFAPERSWGRLKTALNVWFQKRITPERYDYYRIIVKDLLKEDSVLRRVISKALEEHKPIRQGEVKEKEFRKEEPKTLEIPREQLFFTEDYEEILKLDNVKISKCAMHPFYNLKSYRGKENEENFIKYLESKKEIEWWYKNGSSGSLNFAVKYLDKDDEKEKLFFPDWIVKLKSNKIFVLDTKQGLTTKSTDTKYKAEALQEWISKNKRNINGGIVANVSGIWKINNNKEYNWDPNYSEWKNLDELF